MPESLLEQMLPSDAIEITRHWLNRYPVPVKVVGKRKTKSGDYRLEGVYTPARITLNFDSNSYRNLFIFTHEFAHHIAFVTHGRHIKPHGREWKFVFFHLLTELRSHKVFPDHLDKQLPGRASEIRASTAALPQLEKALRFYDPDKGVKTYVEDLADNTAFRINDGRGFKKIKKRRLRFLCQSLDNQKYYILSPGVEVFSL
jgi:hypothetical protein